MTLLPPESERLAFRPHIIEDLEAYCAMEADADFRRYVGGSPRPREQAEARFKNGFSHDKGSLRMWAAIYKPGNTYIGRCGVYQHLDGSGVPVPGEGALGLYFDKAYWGRGLATEAGNTFVGFGFKQLGLSRIVTTIDSRNLASIRVIEKLGFDLERVSELNGRVFHHYQLNRSNFII